MDSDDDVSMITERINKRESLSVTSLVFDQLLNLVHFRRSLFEGFIKIEARFAAKLSRYNSMDTIRAVSEYDVSKRIAATAAAAPKNELLTLRSSISAFLRAVTYKIVVCVLRHFDTQNRGRYRSLLPLPPRSLSRKSARATMR